MLTWLRDLTSRERRTMLACWGGWTLDGFDQQLSGGADAVAADFERAPVASHVRVVMAMAVVFISAVGAGAAGMFQSLPINARPSGIETRG
jgi:hypothetical protein